MKSLMTTDLGEVFFPSIYTSPLDNRVCTVMLMQRFQFIFDHYELLQDSTVDGLIELWRQEIFSWKQMGMSSVFFDNMINFMNKKSIVIDDSVFLISTSLSDLERSLLGGRSSRNSLCLEDKGGHQLMAKGRILYLILFVVDDSI
jgi:hypothetical protein